MISDLIKKPLNRSFFKWSFFILFILLYLWLISPNIYQYSENFRMVSTFKSDEGFYGEIIDKILNENDYEIKVWGDGETWTHYPHFYFYVSAFIVKVFSIFTNITEKSIIIIMRSLSLFFNLGAIFVMYIYMKKYFGFFASIFCSSLILIVPKVLNRYSVMVYPDTMQLLLITLCLFSISKMYQKYNFEKWFNL